MAQKLKHVTYSGWERSCDRLWQTQLTGVENDNEIVTWTRRNRKLTRTMETVDFVGPNKIRLCGCFTAVARHGKQFRYGILPIRPWRDQADTTRLFTGWESHPPNSVVPVVIERLHFFTTLRVAHLWRKYASVCLPSDHMNCVSQFLRLCELPFTNI